MALAFVVLVENALLNDARQFLLLLLSDRLARKLLCEPALLQLAFQLR